MEQYSVTQKQRLIELNADIEVVERQFKNVEERNKSFKETEKYLIRQGREKLKRFLNEEHISLTLDIEQKLEKWLTGSEGFSRVSTPLIISGDKLAKMNIDRDNHLREQVFWIDRKRCLRPMLAPNLYEVMRDINKITKEPVKIFEAGVCFRKESQGAQHMNEFTMLNLVELDSVEDGKQMERLEELAIGAMRAIGIENYTLEKEKSGVYIETLDIVIDGIEVASGAYGPHPLDENWGVFKPWVGIGLGIERLAMAKGNYQTIKRAGRSIGYVDGVPLKL